jgi:hypothetical protein
MKDWLWRLLTALFLLASTSCIFVHVSGDLEDDFWGEDEDAGFHDLAGAVEGCLADPAFVLDLEASPWRTDAEWTVRYASEGSDGHAAYRNVKEAVLRRIEREGGTNLEQRDTGPHAWTCTFRLDGEPGEASVRLVENAGEDDERPHELVVVWEASD